MLTLVDRPPVRPETVESLEAAFLQALTAQKWAVVPENNGKHGHPIIIGRDMVEAFLKAPENATARDVEHQHREKINYVSLPDSMIAVNINTPEDYAALRGSASGIRQ